MSGLHIAIVHPDDDHLRIEVNGEAIATASHDEHGWSGMDAVEKTARAIAEAAGLDISEHWGNEEDEEDLPECGAVVDWQALGARQPQPPCIKPAGHEGGPDTDWKRDYHSNGNLKWRVDRADMPTSQDRKGA